MISNVLSPLETTKRVRQEVRVKGRGAHLAFQLITFSTCWRSTVHFCTQSFYLIAWQLITRVGPLLVSDKVPLVHCSEETQRGHIASERRLNLHSGSTPF